MKRLEAMLIGWVVGALEADADALWAHEKWSEAHELMRASRILRRWRDAR